MLRVLRRSNGKSKEVDISSFRENKDLYWILCSNATMKDLHVLHEKVKIPLYELKHVLDSHEKPRVTSKGRYSLLIFRGLITDSKTRRITAPIEILVGKNFMITIASDNFNFITKTFNDFDLNDWKAITKFGFGALIYNLFIESLRDFNLYLERIHDEVNALEDSAFHALEKDIRELYELKKKVMFLRKSLGPNKDILLSLNEGKIAYIKQNEMFHELIVEIDQIIGSGEIIMEVITGVMEIYFTAVSNKLNEILKSFAVIASLLLIPTLIASIYGMNIVLPFAGHPNAFLIVISIMVISTATMVVFFNKKKWL